MSNNTTKAAKQRIIDEVEEYFGSNTDVLTCPYPLSSIDNKRWWEHYRLLEANAERNEIYWAKGNIENLISDVQDDATRAALEAIWEHIDND
jgi:hypothetical protein